MSLLKNFIKTTLPYKLAKSLEARYLYPEDRLRLRFYNRFLEKGDLCFDVGANVGNRTKVFLKIGARVVAIEPQAECCHHLQICFGQMPNFTLLRTGLGRAIGEMDLYMGPNNQLSSMSSEWLSAVRQSGRFSEHEWDRKESVPLTTLDQLIEKFGKPRFIKIDVEGFEFEVISGLSQPIEYISLEFTPENLENTWTCLAHLERMSAVKVNYSFNEDMKLERESWVSVDQLKQLLGEMTFDEKIFGDIYVTTTLQA
jgi:FkbM family methyltransferase